MTKRRRIVLNIVSGLCGLIIAAAIVGTWWAVEDLQEQSQHLTQKSEVLHAENLRQELTIESLIERIYNLEQLQETE